MRYVVPMGYEAWLYLPAVAGFLWGLVIRKRAYLLLSLVMAVQIAPLAWTAVSNPSPRVHYGALFPFAIVYTAILAHQLRAILRGQPGSKSSEAASSA